MRLLNIYTLEFREFHGDEIPPYLVTSHRWSNDEASYKDVLKNRRRDTIGFKKIFGFCHFAIQWAGKDQTAPPKEGWIWIDTCCINQSSSAEVSESINSMWTWYLGSKHCLAYLRDVRPLSAGWDAVIYDFRRSEWFERGWTLQELLAPTCVIFLTRDFEVIGRKSPENHVCNTTDLVLNKYITDVTGIPQDVLCDYDNRRDTIPKDLKMSWAANRRTTKVEDTAYCLLGIFDVHMPLIYGEGERNARKRLEQEITRREREYEEFSNSFYPFNVELPRIITPRPSTTQSSPGSVPAIPGGQPEVVNPSDMCYVCKELLLEPIAASCCNNRLCESCMTTDDRVNMTIVPLDHEGQLGGDAADYNFHIIQHCPFCNAFSRKGLEKITSFPDTRLANLLRQKYPVTYARREKALFDINQNTQALTIHIGNWHEEFGQDSHRWTFFVKPSRTDIVQEVHIELHESFKNPYVVRKKPPYSFHGRGWGYFNIQVCIVLKPGYVWLSGDAEDWVDGRPGAALKMDWTLDFQSFGGRGAMGRCRVKVRRQSSQHPKPTEAENSTAGPNGEGVIPDDRLGTSASNSSSVETSNRLYAEYLASKRHEGKGDSRVST